MRYRISMDRFRFIFLAVLLAFATFVAAFGMSESMAGMAGGHDIACVSECLSQLLDDAPGAAPAVLLAFAAAIVAFVVVFVRIDAPAFRFAPTVHLDRRRQRYVVRRE